VFVKLSIRLFLEIAAMHFAPFGLPDTMPVLEESFDVLKTQKEGPMASAY